jgi:ribosomal protein S18 acetylase RimI-like enzyme
VQPWEIAQERDVTQEAADRADVDRIRLLEDLGADAWPAATTIREGGWRVGLDRGVTRRANSVLPNAPVTDAEALIDLMERRYRGHGLRPCFKMTVAALPADLDRRLAARGYRAEGHSLVLVADAGAAAPSPQPRVAITLHQQPTAAWLETCWPAERDDQRAALEQIAARVPAPCAFGLARLDGVTAGAALAVANRGWVGLTAVHTLPAYRRRGVARDLLGALTAWANAQGSRQLYLQVEADNGAALRLYAGLGFREAYRYHYRRPAA